ncbi:hypothetical protein KP509_33G030300 [Ceratopteris richardii]|uniref:Peroxidase n=1 Tax=Ceratopteris richardii TaxID=49495 RepID=A0A8T2QMT8_CERRI|nr:hypothetical protein KP509_33G030300 [Ceratopteris richardii]
MRTRISAIRIVLLAIILPGIASANAQLTTDFYIKSCPSVQSIVRNGMMVAVRNETRMAASILRLFFHDCFVQGCDASILLDDTSTMQGEKTAFPNANSVRGFEVVDAIKASVEQSCPGVVSCADILALAARDAVVLSGGPFWNVRLGRRDSLTASYSLANSNLPAPSEDIDTLISKFAAQGLSVSDLVTLSGAHTIGQSRCVNFRDRLYDYDGSAQPDSTLSAAYLAQLQNVCPSSGGDDNLAPLELTTPTRFDNIYYKNLLNGKGLLTSDQELFSSNQTSTVSVVQNYAASSRSFFTNFPTSMIAMGNISPLTGSNGEVRINCRVIN